MPQLKRPDSRPTPLGVRPAPLEDAGKESRCEFMVDPESIPVQHKEGLVHTGGETCRFTSRLDYVEPQLPPSKSGLLAIYR